MADIPIAPLRNDRLQYLLDLADHSRSGSANSSRDIRDVVRDVTEAFQHAHVDFALTGALAFSFYAPARFTADLDIVCREAQRGAINNVLHEAGLRIAQVQLPDRLIFKDPGSEIEINILFRAGDPGDLAATDPNPGDFIGLPTPVIKPEYLLWMYCLSNVRQHTSDALSLLKAGKLDLKKLRKYLRLAQDATAQRRLATLQRLAKREAALGDYSASVVRRLEAKALRKK